MKTLLRANVVLLNYLYLIFLSFTLLKLLTWMLVDSVSLRLSCPKIFAVMLTMFFINYLSYVMSGVLNPMVFLTNFDSNYAQLSLTHFGSYLGVPLIKKLSMYD